MKIMSADDLQIHSNTTSTGYHVKPVIEGLEAPDFRTPTIMRPSIDGGFVPNQLYGMRLISIRGKVYASDVTTYRERRRALIRALGVQRTSAGLKEPILLTFTTMDDLELQVEGYTKGFDFPDRFLTHGDYKWDLVAPNHYIHSQELVNTDIYIFNGGGMEIPMAIPMGMAVGGQNEAILTNEGNIDALPLITFNGPLTNPIVTNLTTIQTMNLTYTLSANQRIEVDTDKRTALYYSSIDAEGVNVRQYITGDFITIAEGDNSIKLTNPSYNAEGFVNFKYRHSYSGI